MTTEAPAETLEGTGWQDAFRLRGDLLQPEVYAFEKALQVHGGVQIVTVGGGTVQATHALKAAIDAGWIESPAVEKGEFSVSENGSGPARKETRYFIGGKGVHEMPAGMVIWYGSRVTQAYREATDIPPNL